MFGGAGPNYLERAQELLQEIVALSNTRISLNQVPAGGGATPPAEAQDESAKTSMWSHRPSKRLSPFGFHSFHDPAGGGTKPSAEAQDESAKTSMWSHRQSQRLSLFGFHSSHDPAEISYEKLLNGLNPGEIPRQLSTEDWNPSATLQGVRSSVKASRLQCHSSSKISHLHDPAGGGGAMPYTQDAAKTVVYWDIENCQVPKGCDPYTIARNIKSALTHMNYNGPVSIKAFGDITRILSVLPALSSTAISLNHVPAGVKDGSDKKILVDMLIWAKANPAPANILLISGDRDFSDALHQLGMQGYNILLAQPPKASAPLVAAAKTVWLWTSLLAGGPPLSNGELQQLALQSSASSAIQRNQKFSKKRRGSDSRYRGKRTQGNPSQPNGPNVMNSTPVGLKENHGYINSNQPVYYTPNVSLSGSAPKFVYTDAYPQPSRPNTFPSSHPLPYPQPSNSCPVQPPPDQLWTNNGNLQGNHQNPYSQPLRPNTFPLQPPSLVPPRTGGHSFTARLLTNVADIGNLNISGYPNSIHDTGTVQQQSGVLKQSSNCNASNPGRPIDERENFRSEVHMGDQKFPKKGRGFDSSYQGKPTWRNLRQPKGPKAKNLAPVGLQENCGNINSYQPGSHSPKVLPSGSAPNFASSSPYPQPLRSNTCPVRPPSAQLWISNLQGNHQNPYSRPNTFLLQPPFVPSNSYTHKSHTLATSLVPPTTGGPSFPAGPLTNMPDSGLAKVARQREQWDERERVPCGRGREKKRKL